MKMEYVIGTWNTPSLPIVGSNARFPVRRIFCVGRNYVEHQKEMGGDGREQPFFFAKSAHDLVSEGGPVHYPPMTTNFHWETELVAVIGTGGYKISSNKANDHIWGYAVGLDMTRRDLQQVGKDKGRPWTFGKDFDRSGRADQPRLEDRAPEEGQAVAQSKRRIPPELGHRPDDLERARTDRVSNAVLRARGGGPRHDRHAGRSRPGQTGR